MPLEYDDRQLQKLFDSLDGKKLASATKSAARFAMKPVKDDIKRNMPRSTGLTASMVEVWAGTDKDQGYVYASAGYSWRRYAKQKRANRRAAKAGATGAVELGSDMLGVYRAAVLRALWIEYGVRHQRYSRRKGKRVKRIQPGGWRIAPRPVIRPALERNRKLVISRFQSKFIQNIKRSLK